jgi:hypothetical protein
MTATAPASTTAVAQELVAVCRAGRNLDAIAKVNGPLVGDDQFSVQYTFDATFKPTGKRTRMVEMALYRV